MMILLSGTLLSGFIPLLFEPFLKENFTAEEYDFFFKTTPILALFYTEDEEVNLGTKKVDIVNRFLVNSNHKETKLSFDSKCKEKIFCNFYVGNPYKNYKLNLV
tara:strand:- start:285 stop:596 length:312 start_codon:yes stop_codon:yes gene_type:complete